MGRNINVRMAKNDDGPAVERLMEMNGFFQWDNWAIDWSDLEPHWLVAELDGEVVGCIQVVPAKPIGRMEVLSVNPELGLISKGAVVKRLTDQAVATNMVYGAQAVSSLISFSMPTFLRCALNRDWITLDEGPIVMRRLR
jgi:N-acetylglutamate synthase-like GNAT family acetyltransferase